MKLRKDKGFMRIVVGLMIISMLLSSTPTTVLANSIEPQQIKSEELQNQSMNTIVNGSEQELLGDFTLNYFHWNRFGVNCKVQYEVQSDNTVFDDDYWIYLEQYNSQGELLSSTPQYYLKTQPKFDLKHLKILLQTLFTIHNIITEKQRKLLHLPTIL